MRFINVYNDIGTHTLKQKRARAHAIVYYDG